MKNFEITRVMQETIYQKHDDAAIFLRNNYTNLGYAALIAIGVTEINKKVFYHLSKPAYDFDGFCASLLREQELNSDNKTYVYDDLFGYLATQSGCLEVACEQPGVATIALTDNYHEYLKLDGNRLEIMRRAENNVDYHSVWSKELSGSEMNEFKRNITQEFKFITKFYDSIKSTY